MPEEPIPTATDHEINIKQKFLDGWIRTRGKKRTEIHISDLIHCCRRYVFEKLDENPPPIDEKTLKYFIGGELKHLYSYDLFYVYVSSSLFL